MKLDSAFIFRFDVIVTPHPSRVLQHLTTRT